MTNIAVQWGKRVKSIEQSDNGVTIHFEDGGSAKGNILIGADGINSVGRLVNKLY
jgi:2-polyprenyl-6-methoxyphenol hydroxylase-like FAD-dependent oxidoreductase